MAPPVAPMLLSFIKQGKPVFTCNAGKIAYVVHAYALASGCTFLGQRAEDAANNEEQELQEGWDLGELLHFLYRTPGDAVLEVKVLPMDDRVMLHWRLQAAGGDMHVVDIRADDFVTDIMQGHKAFKEEHLGNLVERIAPGLDTCIQGSQAEPDLSSGVRGPQQAGRPRDEFSDAVPPAMQPGHGPGTATVPVGYNDLYPPGFGPLDQPMPPMPGVGGVGGGGLHVGPQDPLFQAARRRPPGMGPGARWDPISPEGLPGFHPGDVQRGADDDAWRDLGFHPPPRGGPGGGGRFGGPGFGPGFGGGGFV